MGIKSPATILYPETFRKSVPLAFDGVFDWTWTLGCFGNTKITPMDIDGIVERYGNFLIFETKSPGKKIPQGQLITLKKIHQRGDSTIMLIWGKINPDSFIVWWPGNKGVKGFGKIEARNIVIEWYDYALKNKR